MRRLVLAAVLVATLRAAAEESTVVRGEEGQALDRTVQRSTGGGFWGAVLVAKGGEVVLAKGYGFADYASRANTPRSLFEIASTSKLFTAAAVLKLQMEGKLGLEDPLGKFFRSAPAAKRAITVHQLLTHTSGMSPRVGLPYASRKTRAEFVEYMLSQPLASQPGEKFAYCNSAYALLAALVEIVSGQPFEKYSKDKLFAPARLGDTGFIRDRALDGDRATTRLSKRTPDATARDWFWSWGYRGMGGVVTTAYDLLKWDRALRGDAVLDDKAKAQYYAPVLDGYACGWRVDTTSRGTTKVHHSGGVEGYAVNYVRYLEDDAVVVILSNGKSDISGLTKTLEDRLFPPPRITLDVDVAPYELNQYRAAELDGTKQWTVKKAGDQVVLALTDRSRRHTVATLRLPTGSAGKLRADLARLAGRRAGGKAGMDAGVYLWNYTPREGKLRLTEGLELRVLPRYVGRDEKGKRIVDERVTLVVVDDRRWPVMAKMDARAVQALVEGLSKALK